MERSYKKMCGSLIDILIVLGIFCLVLWILGFFGLIPFLGGLGGILWVFFVIALIVILIWVVVRLLTWPIVAARPVMAPATVVV